jgi:hypothetical protein
MLQASSKPMSGAANVSPFAEFPKRMGIRSRVDFVESLWVDEIKFDRIVSAGKYFQLCGITERIFDKLNEINEINDRLTTTGLCS